MKTKGLVENLGPAQGLQVLYCHLPTDETPANRRSPPVLYLVTCLSSRSRAVDHSRSLFYFDVFPLLGPHTHTHTFTRHTYNTYIHTPHTYIPHTHNTTEHTTHHTTPHTHDTQRRIDTTHVHPLTIHHILHTHTTHTTHTTYTTHTLTTHTTHTTHTTYTHQNHTTHTHVRNRPPKVPSETLHYCMTRLGT